MDPQVARTGKGLGADAAGIRSLARVRPEVHFELVVFSKALGTMRAGIGFLTRVGSFVDPELALMTITLSA